MSDLHFERIAKAVEGIFAHLQKSPVFGLPTGGAIAPKPTTGASAGAGKPDATAAAAVKKAAEEKAAAAAKAAADKAKGATAGTKAPGGKRTIEQVREMIRKVAADANLGKESAKDILRDDGGGVEKVLDLKPENYDKVYEACEVLLKGEGGKGAAAAEEDDLM